MREALTDFRFYRNNDVYSVLRQGAGLPSQPEPEPLVASDGNVKNKLPEKHKMIWILAIGAAFLFWHGFKGFGKRKRG